MYAKHGNLVDADASGAKHLEKSARSFKVTHFGITEKPTRDCVYYCIIMCALDSGNFEGKV